MTGKNQDISLFYDFGVVEVNQVAHKRILVENSSSREKIFEIHCDPLTNPLDHVFDVEPYMFTVQSGQSVPFKLKYSPKVPSSTNFDYFSVFDPKQLAFKFSAKGMCAGPHVECTDLFFLLVSSADEMTAHKLIMLENKSPVSAYFNIHCDDKCGTFLVDSFSGIIKPYNSFILKVTFNAPHVGVFARSLFCLIHYQEPICIELVGVCLETRMPRNKLSPISHPQLPVFQNNYEKFINDSASKTRCMPLLSLSVTNINFTFTNVGEDEISSNVFSVTNHTSTDVVVVWNEDVSENFTIVPQSCAIFSDQSSMFEVQFHPKHTNTLYEHSFIGQVYWMLNTEDSQDDDGSNIYIPLTVCIYVAGNTVTQINSMGKPLYELYPKSVILPPCVPTLPVYTTLILKRCGLKPFTFKFIPPKTTNYTVKPMRGLLSSDHQIVVIQLYPKSRDSAPYIETWGLQFNDCLDYEIAIDFRGYADGPSLEVGWKDMVYFPDSYPGCKVTTSVSVRNLSRHNIKFAYNKLDIPRDMVIPEIPTTILPNEILYQTWSFTPDSLGCKIMQVSCVYQFEEHLPGQSPVSSVINIYGFGSNIELFTQPNELNFGTLKQKENGTMTFAVCNSGHCVAHILLKHYEEGRDTGSETAIILNPRKLSIYPNERKHVTLNVCSIGTGFHEVIINYDVFKSLALDEIVSSSSTVLTTVKFKIIAPKLQLCDMELISGGGGMFSKTTMWNYLQLEKWNKALEALLPNDTETVCLQVLEKVLNSEPLVISLLLKNVSHLTISWRLKRSKECDCPLVTEQKGLSLTEKKYNCPHRSLFTLEPTSGVLKPKETQILRLTVCYTMLGEHPLSYILDINGDRYVKIKTTVNVIPVTELSIMNTTKNINDVFIGDTNPMSDFVWLYNSAMDPLSYDVVNVIMCHKSKLFKDAKILTCLNPKGSIQPKTIAPLFFRLSPLILGSHKAVATIKLGDKEVTVNLSGEARFTNSITCVNKIQSNMPPACSNVFLHRDVTFSLNSIFMRPLQIHTKGQYIFFIKNNTHDVIYKYKWTRTCIDNVCSVSVSPHEGTLQPLGTSVNVLTVESSSNPSNITVDLSCSLFNMTQLRKYEKITGHQRKINEEKKNEFIITEQGIVYPSSNEDFPSAPSPLQKSLSVSCCIYDSENIDSKLSMDNQYRLAPQNTMIISQHKIQKLCLSEEKANFIKGYLSKLIWNILTSRRFEQGYKKDQATWYYVQMKKKESHRIHIKESYNMPSLKFTATILHDIITESLQDIFHVGPIINEEIGKFKQDCRSSSVESHISNGLNDDYIGKTHRCLLRRTIFKIFTPCGF